MNITYNLIGPFVQLGLDNLCGEFKLYLFNSKSDDGECILPLLLPLLPLYTGAESGG
ncbi:unnamed protein product [Schistosoma mattheei]|uniref:Uncharacterized protein n=1 Tax=Schistosoma mattheei TaxID=31246 RepID=A0A183NPR7_9TREM|nr:unnamed protein product [Schistosoma mattheei]